MGLTFPSILVLNTLEVFLSLSLSLSFSLSLSLSRSLALSYCQVSHHYNRAQRCVARGGAGEGCRDSQEIEIPEEHPWKHPWQFGNLPSSAQYQDSVSSRASSGLKCQDSR